MKRKRDTENDKEVKVSVEEEKGGFHSDREGGEEGWRDGMKEG